MSVRLVVHTSSSARGCSRTRRESRASTSVRRDRLALSRVQGRETTDITDACSVGAGSALAQCSPRRPVAPAAVEAENRPSHERPERPQAARNAPRRLPTTASARAAPASTSAATRSGNGSWRPASTAATSARRSCASSTSATCRSPRPRVISARRDSGPKESAAPAKPPAADSILTTVAGGEQSRRQSIRQRTQHCAQDAAAVARRCPPARKPMDLKRLEEWMQIRKRLEQQKKDDDED